LIVDSGSSSSLSRTHGRDARDTARLRVLFALPGLHRVNRGAEVVLEEVASRAALNPQFDVTVFGSGPSRSDLRYRYKKLRGLNRECFEKFPRLPYVRDHYAWEELAYAPSLYRSFHPRDYDVTVTCGYPYTNWILRSGRRRRSRHPAHVFITQNGDWMVRAKNWEFKYFGCDGLVCTNPQYYERHKTRFPSTLIPNGVDVTRFFPWMTFKYSAIASDRFRGDFDLPEDARVILMVSALIPSKRVLDGIRAAAGVPDAHVVVAGDGEQRIEVDALGRHLMGNRFRRLTLAREWMPDLYRAADVLLHMSQDEPFGNIYIEALATGLPIVAHRTRVTEWILEDHATLIDTSDLNAVTQALKAGLVARDPGKVVARRALAEARFSWDAVAKQYCDFFRRVHTQTGVVH
jgi:glycosyltransferase involved in cell wall biosynthesis